MQPIRPLSDKQQFWLKHIEAQQLSGESRNNYCTRHGLKSDQMSYFKKYLKDRSIPGKSESSFVKINTFCNDAVLCIYPG